MLTLPQDVQTVVQLLDVNLFPGGEKGHVRPLSAAAKLGSPRAGARSGLTCYETSGQVSLGSDSVT